MASPAATPLTMPTTSAGNGPLGPAFNVVFLGASIRETAGAVATLRIKDGEGHILGSYSLAAAGSVQDQIGDRGVRADGGLVIEILSGTIEGSARIA